MFTHVLTRTDEEPTTCEGKTLKVGVRQLSLCFQLRNTHGRRVTGTAYTEQMTRTAKGFKRRKASLTATFNVLHLQTRPASVSSAPKATSSGSWQWTQMANCTSEKVSKFVSYVSFRLDTPVTVETDSRSSCSLVEGISDTTPLGTGWRKFLSPPGVRQVSVFRDALWLTTTDNRVFYRHLGDRP